MQHIKSNVFRLRMSQAERAWVRERARDAGLTESAWVRERIGVAAGRAGQAAKKTEKSVATPGK